MSELFEGNTGWLVGYIIGIVVVLVVVALVVPILVLASKIGSEAQMINESLQKSVQNTAALADLGTTNQMAVNIIPASSGAGSGWEDDHGLCPHREPGDAVADRQLGRARRRARRGRSCSPSWCSWSAPSTRRVKNSRRR